MKGTFKIVLKGFSYAVTVSLFIVVIGLTYVTGLVQGYNFGKTDTEIKFIEIINDKIAQNREEANKIKATPTVTLTPTPLPVPKSVSWGGPELWSAVNKKRSELGVNALSQRDELCTIASIRLNELLEFGKLDGHEGFGNLKERRPDLAWIFDKYSVMAEFLATGGSTPAATVSMWENTLGHKKILDGGEFVWGCIYAQDTFSVAIVAY